MTEPNSDVFYNTNLSTDKVWSSDKIDQVMT